MNISSVDAATSVDWSVLMLELLKHKDVKVLANEVGVTYQCLNSIKSGNNEPSYRVGTKLRELWITCYLPLKPPAGSVKPRKHEITR